MADDRKKIIDKKNDVSDNVRVFKPIVAIAKVVDKIDGKDVLELEIPLEEDVNEIHKHYKPNIKKTEVLDNTRGKIMDKEEVDKLVDEKLNKTEFNRKINDIETTSKDTNKNTNSLVSKVSSIDNVLNDMKNEIEDNKNVFSKTQSETCNGVNCIKTDLEKLGKKYDTDISELAKTVNSIKETPRKSLCTGKGGCNGSIETGSSFCPNCGRSIDEWPDMPDWKPFKNRSK